jgi:hypothetical protein
VIGLKALEHQGIQANSIVRVKKKSKDEITKGRTTISNLKKHLVSPSESLEGRVLEAAADWEANSSLLKNQKNIPAEGFLKLKKGDVIHVIKEDLNSVWWKGRMNDKGIKKHY